jgi:hypothetical protein
MVPEAVSSLRDDDDSDDPGAHAGIQISLDDFVKPADWPVSDVNQVDRRLASTNCYQERLSLGNTAVSSPRAGA